MPETTSLAKGSSDRLALRLLQACLEKWECGRGQMAQALGASSWEPLGFGQEGCARFSSQYE